MLTWLGGYGIGSQSWAYQSAAEILVRIFERLTSAPRPVGVGNWFGTPSMCRWDGFQVVPSKSSRDTIRRYMSERSVVLVSTDRTWRFSSTFRLSRSETSGLTAEIVPPLPVPAPTPVPAASSRPPEMVGSGSRAMATATAPIRRPVRTGASGPEDSEPGVVRGAPPKTRPHWASRSRPSASSSIR